MIIFRTNFIILALFVTIALGMVPALASSGTAQEFVIYTDDVILGRITSITPDPDAGELSVTITSLARGMNTPQPAKVGDTLLQNDVIILVPGASANVKFADRPESTLRGGPEGTGFVIRRGTVAVVTETPEAADVVATETMLQQRTYTIPSELSGQIKSVTIYDTGGNEDYILRGGEKILAKRNMEIKGGDKIYIVGKYSIELSNGKILPPGTIWTINEPVKTLETVPEQEWLVTFVQPFFGAWDDFKRGFATFFSSGY